MENEWDCLALLPIIILFKFHMVIEFYLHNFYV